MLQTGHCVLHDLRRTLAAVERRARPRTEDAGHQRRSRLRGHTRNEPRGGPTPLLLVVHAVRSRRPHLRRKRHLAGQPARTSRMAHHRTVRPGATLRGERRWCCPDLRAWGLAKDCWSDTRGGGSSRIRTGSNPRRSGCTTPTTRHSSFHARPAYRARCELSTLRRCSDTWGASSPSSRTRKYRAFYFNPSDGSQTDLGPVVPNESGEWRPPAPPIFRDWVLVSGILKRSVL